jgi:hypothetical protein
MPFGEAPGGWKAAAAMAVLTLLALGWAEARMDGRAQAAVQPVKAEHAVYVAQTDGRLGRIEDDVAKTREAVEKLLADCYARGGCR